MPDVEPIALEPVDALTITTLVDNLTDILLVDEGPAVRPKMGSGPRVPAPALEGGAAFDALRAEHGFAALVTFSRGGREHRVLFDTGISPDGLVENMRRLELSPRDVEAIVLSHGHFDHVGGMQGLIRELGTNELPVFLHPEAWNRRRIALPGREPVLIASPSRHALEGAGFEIAERREPSFLLEGALLVTGDVDRTTTFEQGLAPSHQACRDGEWQPDQLVLDDQALVANVRGKGLVVLTGCGHAGIVNTLRHVMQGRGRRASACRRRRLPSQRATVRAADRPDVRRVRGARARLPRAHPLHGLGGRRTRSPRASPTRSCRTVSAPAPSSRAPATRATAGA